MKYLALALQYLPYVLAGVKAVEDTLAGSPGASKKAVVLSSIAAAAQVGTQVPEDHVKLVSALIDSVVASLNASGIFKSSKPAAVAAVAGVAH